MARGGAKVRRQGGLKGTEMTEAKIVGGSEADRSKLLELHEEYLVANGKFDWPAIKHIWSEEPHATFFNLNGHTYNGARALEPAVGLLHQEREGLVLDAVRHRRRDQGRHGRDLVPSPVAAQLGRHHAEPPRDIHYQGQDVRQPLDHGVPQGERRSGASSTPTSRSAIGGPAGRKLQGLPSEALAQEGQHEAHAGPRQAAAHRRWRTYSTSPPLVPGRRRGVVVQPAARRPYAGKNPHRAAGPKQDTEDSRQFLALPLLFRKYHSQGAMRPIMIIF